MHAVDIIAKKRDGEELTAKEIDFFVQGYTRGDVPDYQAAAWLMAVFLRGMSRDETVALTMSMGRSGEVLNLKDIAPLVVDKHSTGGVGDKTTLFVGPMVAALGLPVGKMSGRALGFSGGTLDKLESIPGFQADLSTAQFLAQLRAVGLVVSGQSADLAPADGKLYALRDVTATVPSLSLIASSIMSKKLASGSDAIVLDVKVGSGAFMGNEEEAIALAQIMVDIGHGAARRVTAIVSDMSQPLGNAVGNALEVKEAIDALHGGGPEDFVQHCLAVAEQMVMLGGKAAIDGEARRLLLQTVRSGQAWAKFREFVAAQGGDVAVVDDPALLPQATIVEDLPAPREGYIAAIDAARVGMASMRLGAGRAKKGDPIDYAVGVVLQAKVGDRVEAGQPLLAIHANDADRLAEAREQLLSVYSWSDAPVSEPPLIHRVITG